MIKTAREYELEILRLRDSRKEVLNARIDELWPTYYSAQIALARNSMDAMSKVLGCKSIEGARGYAEEEIASLIRLISELEDEEGGK